MINKTFYYARVSSREQNLNRQLDAFVKLGATERDIVVDKESGKNLDRPRYQALKNTILRAGDTLVIISLDRLSRNKSDLKHEIEYFRASKIRLKILDMPTTLMDPPEGQEWVFDMVQNILIEVLGSFAESERLAIRKRQREGIDSALERGVKFGRPRIEKPENWDKVYVTWKAGAITAVEAMRRVGLKKTKFYKLVQEQNNVK